MLDGFWQRGRRTSNCLAACIFHDVMMAEVSVAPSSFYFTIISGYFEQLFIFLVCLPPLFCVGTGCLAGPQKAMPVERISDLGYPVCDLCVT